MQTPITKLPRWYTLLVSFGVLAFLLFIAYHDEGYNNWSWMQDAGSWVFLFIAWNVLFWTLMGAGLLLKIAIKVSSPQNTE